MKTETALALQRDKALVQQALWKAMPAGIRVEAIIIALAEMQKEMALIWFDEFEYIPGKENGTQMPE